MTMIPHIGVQANQELAYKSFWFSDSKVHYIATNGHLLSVRSTLKGHVAGVNCSYFNMNTMKPVPVGIYNRPFIIIKNDGSVKISDNKADLIDYKEVASGGSWLLKNGEFYTTEDHFTKGFKNNPVRRTCIGVDKNGKVYLVVMTKASLTRAARIMKKLGLVDAMNVDGGTSSIMKYNGKILVSGGRRVANYITID